MTEYRQVELTDDNGTFMLCWVDNRPNLKQGVWLTLKDIPDIVWRVCNVYNKTTEHPRRTWRVGGLQ